MSELNEHKRIPIDKFYNLIKDNQNIYEDDGFVELLDEIIKEKEGGKLTDDEMNILVKILLIRQAKEEMKSLKKWSEIFEKRKEKHSLLMNISTKERKYA